jgi:hypothetical protein
MSETKISEYVQIKPVLAIVTLILKAAGKYNEGDLRWDSGYIYVSIVYNFSIFLALYCLAMFWMCVSEDLKPFRPTPKFLCVKGILFFSFWQAIGISILVSIGTIKKLGPYTDHEHISLGLTDTLICLEMPLFALAHSYAFSHTDFVDRRMTWVARMPIWYALRDAFGVKDVVEDTMATLAGEGIDYRQFEPAEGYMHQGLGRERRIRAGLRYADGGRKKYWLPKTTAEGPDLAEAVDRGMNRAIARVAGMSQEEDVYAPLLEDEADDVVHLAPDLQPDEELGEDGLVPGLHATMETDRDAYLLPFGDIDPADEELFEHSRRYLFGDYNYPVIDASSEQARFTVWEEEERILSDARGAYFSPRSGGPGRPLPAHGGKLYGAVGTHTRPRVDSNVSTSGSQVSSPRNAGKERVINREDDQTIAVETGDVRMRWTKANPKKAHFSPAISRSNSGLPSPRGSPSQRVPVSRTSSSRSGVGTGPPPSPRDETKRAVLPPDAVDLVVEDPEAEARIAEEHRRGEPQGREFRRVFRRGFVGPGVEGEIEELGNERVPEKTPAEAQAEAGEEFAEEAIPMVQEVEQPPALAQILQRPDDDENPWA